MICPFYKAVSIQNSHRMDTALDNTHKYPKTKRPVFYNHGFQIGRSLYFTMRHTLSYHVMGYKTFNLDNRFHYGLSMCNDKMLFTLIEMEVPLGNNITEERLFG